MATRHVDLPRQPRPHRWIAWTIAVLVLLGAYAIALRWVTLRVESGVAASIHPVATERQQAPPE